MTGERRRRVLRGLAAAREGGRVAVDELMGLTNRLLAHALALAAIAARV